MTIPSRPGPTSKARFALPKKTPAERARAKRILAALYRAYPDAHCELDYETPDQLLVATILSAQTTDVAVNKATPRLFRDFPGPASYGRTTPRKLEPYVKSLGFFRNKAKAIHAAMTEVQETFGGVVPRTMDELLTLRGVARKTANVVLGTAFGINVGVVVDTHVARISRRLELTVHADPGKIETDLMALFPRPHWSQLSHLLIWHGRQRCSARNPKCNGHAICRHFCCEYERP